MPWAAWRSTLSLCRRRDGIPARDAGEMVGRSQAVRQRILIPPFGGSIPPAPAKQSRVGGVLRPARQKARQFGISRELRHTGEGGTEPITTPDTPFSPSAIGVLRFGDGSRSRPAGLSLVTPSQPGPLCR